MKRNNFYFFRILLPLFLLFCGVESTMAIIEVRVETAGTLSTLLTSTETTLKISGSINGTDIKYLRQLVNEGKVTDLDFSGVNIVSGGEAYFESYTTEEGVIGHSMFKECKNLKTIILPENIGEIKANAFSGSGLRKIDIPNSVSVLGGDAFAYCGSLDTVIIGRRVASLGQGVFYASSVKFAYNKILNPPGTPAYLFSSRPKMQVYTESLDAYKQSSWTEYYGSIVGGLEELYPLEPDPADAVNNLREVYFEDAACT